jgi:hypothetical protein
MVVLPFHYKIKIQYNMIGFRKKIGAEAGQISGTQISLDRVNCRQPRMNYKNILWLCINGN